MKVTHCSAYRRQKSAFTLIELLVVIAIIAILAAILFPVFAQVREKARQTSCLSNMKQLGMAITQYTQDFDETFPQALDGNEWDPTKEARWAQKILPYVKTYGAYECPDDKYGGQYDPNPGYGYQGIMTSYAANSYANYDWTGFAGPNGFRTFGVMAAYFPTGPGGTGTPQTSRDLSSIGRPSDTILLCEKFSDDLFKAGLIGNHTAFGNTGLIGGIAGWYYDGSMIPDGTRGAAPYPTGPNGGVTPYHAGGTMANFLFCDGHVKTMRPTLTDPDPNNRRNDNMWDATRQ